MAGLATVAWIAVAMAVSGLAFGWGVFRAWLANGPDARRPELAIDPVVQSLLALLYRALGATPRGSLPAIVLYPPFLLAAGALTLATLAILWRPAAGPRSERAWLLLCLALLCYPNTLISTLALLFPVILAVFWTGLARGWPFGLAAGFVLALYALTGFWIVEAGWAALLGWAGAAALLLLPARAAAPAPPA